MTKTEVRKQLDAAGIAYNPKDSVGKLANLLEQAKPNGNGAAPAPIAQGLPGGDPVEDGLLVMKVKDGAGNETVAVKPFGSTTPFEVASMLAVALDAAKKQVGL